MKVRDSNALIQAARIEADIAALAAITEPDRPWTRRAFTPKFSEGRAWVEEKMRRAGLQTRIDAGGNLIGRRPGHEAGRGTLMIGSHSDTVPSGGRYDGVAGVVAGLEVARALADAGITLAHDLEIVDFLAEEVSIFGVSCLGSRAMTGQVPAAWLQREAEGRSLAQAVAEVGGSPDLGGVRDDIHAFLELHIEQGSVLQAAGAGVGIVTSFTGITRVALRVQGRADHAGTTPMAGRDDALVRAARLVGAIDDEARRRAAEGRGHFTATLGEFSITPGAANVVPGSAALLLDARASEPGVMAAFLAWLEHEIAGQPIALEVISDTAPIPCDLGLCDRLEAAAAALGTPGLRMVSGAGHDTAWMSKIAPAAMVFVPCLDGRSHCPEEWASAEDIAAGTAVLLETLMGLDRQPRA